MPFGEELYAGVGNRTGSPGQGYDQSWSIADKTRQKFTSKERDIETGLDYFGARYYASVHGRFGSVDPISLDEKRIADPQFINVYIYARNNPLRYIDPDGADPIEVKLLLSGQNKVTRSTSTRQLDKKAYKELGPKNDLTKGAFFNLNIEVKFDSPDDPAKYKPFLAVYVQEPNQSTDAGQQPRTWTADEPSDKLVTRDGDTMVFQDNPGISSGSAPKASLGTFVAYYIAGAVPKDADRKENPKVFVGYKVSMTIDNKGVVTVNEVTPMTGDEIRKEIEKKK